MKKILITGSAPYFPDWWEKNKSKLDMIEIHSINTSVLITKERCNKWWKSTDFYNHHRDLEEQLKIYESRCPYQDSPKQKTNNSFQWPFVYWKNNTSGTMLFNVLLELIKTDFWCDHCFEEVNVVGCDLVYKLDVTNHFYGASGTNDPMRLGADCITRNLDMFKRLYCRMGVGLYNLSPASETLLPFERKTL